MKIIILFAQNNQMDKKLYSKFIMKKVDYYAPIQQRELNLSLIGQNKGRNKSCKSIKIKG